MCHIHRPELRQPLQRQPPTDMSLKAFHIVFIAASILLSVGFAGWEVVVFRNTHRSLDLIFAALSLLAGTGLVFYSRYVLRKLKDISYL